MIPASYASSPIGFLLPALVLIYQGQGRARPRRIRVSRIHRRRGGTSKDEDDVKLRMRMSQERLKYNDARSQELRKKEGSGHGSDLDFLGRWRVRHHIPAMNHWTLLVRDPKAISPRTLPDRRSIKRSIKRNAHRITGWGT
ncbi:hypothetical protein F4813DRAFT_391714 [Daldinia decipiens]|uniref:uncharacterized protein n=1 Tax=Daldinia decipiens TaxID=326647 RepID=UPI0020C2CA1A|nr:uncharacterized protein F4813DRAFT_391714 [Daldinia decipiens]KAI1655291.1 hypothetical protein F4813DRAFT_391714 [Daldinia decipiens]